LSYEETAEVLETSVATVKTRILRGRRALKELLEPVLRAHKAPGPERPIVHQSDSNNTPSHRLGPYGAVLLSGGRGGWQ